MDFVSFTHRCMMLKTREVVKEGHRGREGVEAERELQLTALCHSSLRLVGSLLATWLLSTSSSLAPPPRWLWPVHFYFL